MIITIKHKRTSQHLSRKTLLKPIFSYSKNFLGGIKLAIYFHICKNKQSVCQDNKYL